MSFVQYLPQTSVVLMAFHYAVRQATSCYSVIETLSKYSALLTNHALTLENICGCMRTILVKRAYGVELLCSTILPEFGAAFVPDLPIRASQKTPHVK